MSLSDPRSPSVPGSSYDASGAPPQPNPNLRIDRDVVMAYPTPILQREWPGNAPVNAALRDLILERERQDPGLPRANIGGWHSQHDLFNWPHPAIETFGRWVAEATQHITDVTCGALDRPMRAEMNAEGWANILRDGGYTNLHNHPGFVWSGVYYVSAGEKASTDTEGGLIEFVDPRVGANSGLLPNEPFGAAMRFSPREGCMLVFPNWLYHHVTPFRGRGERISISFNIRLRFVPA